MIDVDRIQISVSAPARLETLLSEQLAVIQPGERLWAWSPLNLLLQQGLEHTRLSELLKNGSRCLSVEKIGLSYHLSVGVSVAAESRAKSKLDYEIQLIADCFGLSIANIDCKVRTSCLYIPIS